MTAVVTTVVGCALACFAFLSFAAVVVDRLAPAASAGSGCGRGAEEKDGMGPRPWTTFLACRTSRRDGVADPS